MNYLRRKRRRDIRKQRWQFIAVGATVLVGVLMFVATFDSYQNLSASYNQTYRRLAFANMTISGGDPGLPETLATLPGVAAVEVRHTVDLPVTIGSTTLRGRLVGMPVGTDPAVNRIDVQTGSGLVAPDAHEAVAEVHVARTFELAAGDAFTVAVGGESVFEVVGVAASPEYIWPAASTQEIFVDPKQFGVFFVDESLLAQVADSRAVRETLVLYDDGADAAATDALVHDTAVAAGSTSILTRAEHPSNATLQLDVEGFGEMAVAFPVLFLTAAGLALYVLLTRLVVSQRSVIGTLRASGMPAGALRSHYLGFGLLLGGIGGVAGAVLGFAVGGVMTAIYTGVLDIPDTVVAFRPATLIAGVVFGLTAGGLSAYAPARAASRTAPAEAMRGAGPAKPGRRSFLERLVPSMSRLPVSARMTLRGIGRARRRSLTTVVGVVLALTLVLASGGMIDTIVRVIDRQFNEIAVQDAMAIASAPVDESIVSAVRGVPGVSSAEPVATLAASVSASGTTTSTTLQGFETGTVMHGWTNDSERLPASGLVVNRALADKLDLQVGDTVTVRLPTLGAAIDLAVVDTVNEPLGLPMYASIGAIRDGLAAAGDPDPSATLASPAVTSVMARFDPAADRSRVIADIDHIEQVLTVQDARTLYELAQQFLGLFYVFVGVMLAFGGLMAFALMFNTISVNVAERSTEFATLKANGMADRTVGWLIAAENLLLTALGVVPGLLLGTLVAAEFLATFNNDSFSFELWISPVTYAVAVLGMFGVALLSMLPGIRSIRRLDIGAVVRERSI